MICPHCDNILTEDERLVIHHTRADGYFQVDHVLVDNSDDSITKIHGSKMYNRLSID